MALGKKSSCAPGGLTVNVYLLKAVVVRGTRIRADHSAAASQNSKFKGFGDRFQDAFANTSDKYEYSNKRQ